MAETLDLAQLWVTWAVEALSDSLALYETYDDYYRGDHELAFATDKWRDTFGSEFEEFSDNWCQVVVDSMVQRLQIKGWKCEDDASSSNSQKLATLAEDIWDRNELDTEATDLHTQTAVKGDGYLMVWPNPDKVEEAQIYYNDAADIAVYYDPANRRRVARATKRYIDERGQVHLWLYTRENMKHFFLPSHWTPQQVATAGLTGEIPEALISGGWEQVENLPNKQKVIPVFHFKNRAHGSTHGLSELKSVIPMQNAVNKLLMDLMVGSEFGSFRQKYAIGAGVPKNADGTEGWRTGNDRVWHSSDPLAKFGEFGQIDLKPIFDSVEGMVSHLAKITQTPMHYLRSSGDMPSGEALKTSESGLVHKCVATQKSWGAAWSRAMSFAIQLETGSVPSSPVKPVWEKAETRHDLEQGQVAQLKSILGIPLEQLWSEHFNYSQEEIDEFKKQNKAVAATVLADVIAQIGQLPPGAADISNLDPKTLMALLSQGGSAGGDGTGLATSQILATLPKGVTAQTTAGEAATKPQPSTKPPPSPTRRKSGTGYKD